MPGTVSAGRCAETCLWGTHRKMAVAVVAETCLEGTQRTSAGCAGVGTCHMGICGNEKRFFLQTSGLLHICQACSVTARACTRFGVGPADTWLLGIYGTMAAHSPLGISPLGTQCMRPMRQPSGYGMCRASTDCTVDRAQMIPQGKRWRMPTHLWQSSP